MLTVVLSLPRASTSGGNEVCLDADAMNAAAVQSPPRPATLEDLLALPDAGQGHEILDGELVEKETSAEHSGAQAGLTGSLYRRFQRRPGGRWPGGWWFLTEPLVAFPSLKAPLRPDVAGWRRENMPERPRGVVVDQVPDWLCEIISPGNYTNDTIKKKRIYHQHQVKHYWLIDPLKEALQVYRWTPAGYVEILSAERGEIVRAEPFEAVEIPLGVFFGDDDEED